MEKILFDGKCPHCGTKTSAWPAIHYDYAQGFVNEYECTNCKNRYKVTCDFKNFYLGDWNEVFTKEELLEQDRQHNEQIKKVVSRILEGLKTRDELDFNDYKNPSNNLEIWTRTDEESLE